MKFDVVYVLCPTYLVTGGTEALHQLVDGLIRLGQKAHIVYFNSEEIGVKHSVPIKFKHYRIKISNTIFDSTRSAVVIPETAPEILLKYSNSKKYLWWLSADYCSDKAIALSIKIGAMNLYQSNYARIKMIHKGVNNRASLSDYSVKYPFKSVQKQNVVALTTTKIHPQYIHLIQLAKRVYHFVLIENMSRKCLSKTLNNSTVLIDLGMHPGKDRMPREAVLCNNYVITSYFGACVNETDVPIDKSCKIDLNIEPKEFCSLVNDLLSNNSNVSIDSYKERVEFEKQIFFNEISDIFNLKPIQLSESNSASLKFWSNVEEIIFRLPISNTLKKYILKN